MLEIKTQIREKKEDKNNQLRIKEFIPAILYGHKIKNLLLKIKLTDFDKVYRQAGESSLVKLLIEDKDCQKKERVVFIYDVAKDPVSDKAIHVDFYQVKMDEPITIEVPLVFKEEAPAVKEKEGVLVKNIQNIEIEALPQNLPHQIEIDISGLKEFDDIIRVKDIKISPELQLKADPEEVVVSVIPPRTEEELKELEESPAEGVEEVEVEEKGKEEETKEEDTSKEKAKNE